MNAAYQSLAGMIGKGEADAAIADYLRTGGQNLDPQVLAWCAAAVNSAITQAGGKGTGSNMARSFLDWGQPVDQPQKGDVAVFSRGDPNGPFGHVGFFDGYNPDGTIRVLGGNQGDAVSIANYSADNLLGFRRGEMGTPAQGPQPPQNGPQNALAAFQPTDMRQDPNAFMRAPNALAEAPLMAAPQQNNLRRLMG